MSVTADASTLPPAPWEDEPQGVAMVLHLPPVQAAVMPCSGCREPLNLSDMVWLSGDRVGCAQCARRGG